MRWKKKELTNYKFEFGDTFDVTETKTTIYESDKGHVIEKDSIDGYWYGNHWFKLLKDAKVKAESV